MLSVFNRSETASQLIWTAVIFNRIPYYRDVLVELAVGHRAYVSGATTAVAEYKVTRRDPVPDQFSPNGMS